MLGQDDLGARVVLAAEDISLTKGESNESSIESDRLKALGDFEIEIRVKGGDAVRRSVSVRAQD